MDERSQTKDTRGLKALVITGSILAAIVWPLQAIALLVLLTAAMTCIGVYNTWLSHHAMVRSHRRFLNHAIGDVTIVVLGLGAVAAAVFPIATMAVALCLAVVAGLSWGAAWMIEFLAAAQPGQRPMSVELRSRQRHPAVLSTRRAQTSERSSTRAAA